LYGFSKENILRSSHYYEELFKQHGVLMDVLTSFVFGEIHNLRSVKYFANCSFLVNKMCVI